MLPLRNAPQNSLLPADWVRGAPLNGHPSTQAADTGFHMGILREFNSVGRQECPHRESTHGSACQWLSAKQAETSQTLGGSLAVVLHQGWRRRRNGRWD